MLRHTMRFLVRKPPQCLLRTRFHHVVLTLTKHEFHSSSTNATTVNPTSDQKLAQDIRSQSTTGISGNVSSILRPLSSTGLSKSFGYITENDATHHLHVYTHKHNTHIALTKPNNDALISMSTGNIGFRKASRGSYDAGYQLAAYVLNKIQSRDLLAQIRNIEIVLTGFGAGRKAVVEVLLGNEGRNIRGRITTVSDATRLKFGGVRSKKPRRL